MAKNDILPFPIQGGGSHRRTADFGLVIESCTIPWWLAEIAYEHYAKLFGTSQSLKRLAERGGFGRDELLILLRKEKFT
jgi:hypothetical protein